MIHQVVNVTEKVFGSVDHFLEDDFDLVAAVVVRQAIVRAKLIKESLEAKQICVKAAQLRGSLRVVVVPSAGRGLVC